MAVMKTLIDSKSKELFEIFRDIRTSICQILQNWGKLKSNNKIAQVNMRFDSCSQRCPLFHNILLAIVRFPC